jgi:hypothetical protein
LASPSNRAISAIHHCDGHAKLERVKFLQTYGKWKYPEWDIAFRDLPLLLTKTQWVDELTNALRANKFLDIKVEYLIFGASAIVSARK